MSYKIHRRSVWLSVRVSLLSLGIGGALWADTAALAQDPTALSVRRTTDTQARRVVGSESLLLIEAFEVGSATQPINRSGRLLGLPDGAMTNRAGRIDERPRMLHRANEPVRFESLPLSGAASLSVQPKLRPDWMLAHFIDVGQGNATLLEFSCGAALIDTGGQLSERVDSNAALLAYLDAFFKRRSDLERKLALVVLTHPHIDHTRGVLGLLGNANNKIKIGSVVVNARENGSGWAQQRKLIQHARAKSLPLSLITNESIIRSDGLTNADIDPLSCATVDPEIRVLWGSDSATHNWTRDDNNHSVVVRVDFKESSFLFTGDMESDAQPEFVASYALNPDIINADIYQVGHHGSRNGTTDALLRVLTPEIAVIGAGNPADQEGKWSAYEYGHPNLVAINLLSDPDFGVTLNRPEGTFAVGIKGKRPGSSEPPRYQFKKITGAIFATGWDGDIVIAASADGKKIVQTD